MPNFGTFQATVAVNKKFTFRFKKNDRFTVNRFIKKRYYYRKETQRSRHPETKWNVQKTEQKVLRTIYTVNNTDKV